MRHVHLPQVLPAALAVAGSLGLASSLVACSSDGSPQDSSAVSSSSSAEGSPVEQLTVEVHQVHPFDQTSFTQGLEIDDDGALVVGTGMEGESRIYRTTLDGQEQASADLDPEFFGEGITLYDDHIWQLTWLDGVAIKRDAETLKEVDRAPIAGEGWGLCSFDEEIIYSDGSDQLRRMDPDTLEERERFEVTMDGSPVGGLNELECVGSEVYANIFTTTDIVRIDAATGEVTAVIDASSLPNNATPDPNHVLNGIAHIPGSDRFLLTGKRWPDMYEVSFVGAGAAG